MEKYSRRPQGLDGEVQSTTRRIRRRSTVDDIRIRRRSTVDDRRIRWRSTVDDQKD
jgi:hypothetical protein